MFESLTDASLSNGKFSKLAQNLLTFSPLRGWIAKPTHGKGDGAEGHLIAKGLGTRRGGLAYEEAPTSWQWSRKGVIRYV